MKISDWERLSVLKKITFLIVIVTCLFIGYSLFIYTGFFMIKINGTVYNDIKTGEDLRADILPPPEYIIEPFQISLEMLEERDSDKINKSIYTLKRLHSDYISRHKYWEELLNPGQIRDKMVDKSYIPAMKFWEDMDLKFIPAMENEDYETAKIVVYGSMRDHYQEHRAVIDEVVTLVEEQNKLNEQIAEKKEILIYFGMICIAILLFLTLILVELILLHLLRPLKETTLMIQEMSRGHLSRRLDINRSDEIGDMAKAMNNLADYLQDTFTGLCKIAKGDLAGSFKAKDEYDEIAPIFNHLILSLKEIMNEVRYLINEAEEGRLQNRRDPARFEGLYREIISGINNMLDAIVIPLNEVLRVADEFSYAHFTARFDNNILVKGDLVALREGLNSIGEELSVLNYKLSLLSSITRHDIMNQITVLNSGLDVIEDCISPDNSCKHILELIRSATYNIREQISFTAVYEKMGVQKPTWHRISSIILKTRDSLNLNNIVILDNTQDLEIYADPLFSQVIYNLMDNALRHGRSLTHIAFSFKPYGEDGILVITDNGVGIADENKNDIFQKGFGNNTGLGLFLIREILAFNHITIRETGMAGKGARFEIYLPKGIWRINQSNYD